MNFEIYYLCHHQPKKRKFHFSQLDKPADCVSLCVEPVRTILCGVLRPACPHSHSSSRSWNFCNSYPAANRLAAYAARRFLMIDFLPLLTSLWAANRWTAGQRVDNTKKVVVWIQSARLPATPTNDMPKKASDFFSWCERRVGVRVAAARGYLPRHC